jgi:hypothetical protein
MSALGQKATLLARRAMSALLLKADIPPPHVDVGFGP